MAYWHTGLPTGKQHGITVMFSTEKCSSYVHVTVIHIIICTQKRSNNNNALINTTSIEFSP